MNREPDWLDECVGWMHDRLSPAQIDFVFIALCVICIVAGVVAALTA